MALAVLALVGCGSGSSDDTGRDTTHFDARFAWRLTERQVDVGQRPAGSPQLRRLADELKSLLPAGKFEPIPGEPGLRNVIGVLPGAKPAIVVGAHYDTLAVPRGFVGANNGAAGTAVVIAAARALSAAGSKAGDREVRFVLFDGEEPPQGLPKKGPRFYVEGLRGSRAYVAAHPTDTAVMILLDYVGNRGLYLPREANSSKGMWSRLLAAAKAVGARRFFSAKTGPPITDDHAPFLRARIPAIDLIDWRYPGHSLADQLNRLSPKSLAAVGETVVRLVGELRRE